MYLKFSVVSHQLSAFFDQPSLIRDRFPAQIATEN
jgi:hypothetical protein